MFGDLNQYAATMHFNGQSTIYLDGDRATGESYCLAHHLTVTEDGHTRRPDVDSSCTRGRRLIRAHRGRRRR